MRLYGNPTLPQAGWSPNGSSRLGRELRCPRKTFFSYCVAILGGPSYAATFENEMATPDPHIPITLRMPNCLLGAHFSAQGLFGFRHMVSAGCRPNQTNGKKFRVPRRSNKQFPKIEAQYPNEFGYDEHFHTHTLCVGDGIISGVSVEVFGYSVSGFKVVPSWLRYRMKQRGGRARRETTRSELDEIRPCCWMFTPELLQLLWVVEGCVGLWPELELFLAERSETASRSRPANCQFLRKLNKISQTRYRPMDSPHFSRISSEPKPRWQQRLGKELAFRSEFENLNEQAWRSLLKNRRVTSSNYDTVLSLDWPHFCANATLACGGPNGWCYTFQGNQAGKLHNRHAAMVDVLARSFPDVFGE